MNTVEILKAARERISMPERWTKEAYARRASDNKEVSPHSPDAFCWCAYGAIHATTMDVTTRLKAYPFFWKAIGRRRGMQWNDAPERTHAEVLAAFDRAIALAESE